MQLRYFEVLPNAQLQENVFDRVKLVERVVKRVERLIRMDMKLRLGERNRALASKTNRKLVLT